MKMTPFKTLAAIVAGAAVLGYGSLYLTYDTFSPCTALHQKARVIINAGLMQHLKDHPAPDGPFKGLAEAFALKMISVMPIDELIDTKLTERWGAAGPLQCTAALVSFDWNGMRTAMRDKVVNQAKR
jgi:hypothetical protein